MSYSITDFDDVPSAKEIVAATVNLEALPSVDQVKTLAKWTPEVVELFEQPYEQGQFDRSAALARLAYSGAELNWTDEQIAAVVFDADTRWGKYTARRPSTRENIILNLINRAREKHGYTQMGEIDLSRFTKAPDPADPTAEREPLIWGFEDFIGAEFHIDWILDQMLPQGGIGLITGYPGTGKTQLMLQMASCFATGRDRYLKWKNVAGTKKVLFLSLEMGKPSMHHFMQTMAPEYSKAELNTMNRNFLVAPFGEALPLDTEKGQAFMDNLLDEFMPDVVFIDSLQMIVSKEMTDELAVKALFVYLKALRAKYNCAIVIVHHNRKRANEAQKKSEPDLNDVYGSAFIAAEVEFILSARKTDIKDVLELDVLKNRLGREQDSFEVFRDKHLHFDDEIGNITERLTTAAPEPGQGAMRL